MVRLISKLSVLSFLFASFNSTFGMISTNHEQKVCNDNLLRIAYSSDVDTKNKLRIANKLLCDALSINNPNFLLSLSPQDKENLWLKNFWHNNTNNQTIAKLIEGKIKIRSYSYYNTLQLKYGEPFSLFFTSPPVFTINLKDIEEYKKQQPTDTSTFTRYNYINCTSWKKPLQIAMLCNDTETVLSFFLKIKNKFSEIKNYSGDYLTTRIMLEEAMRRNNKEMFKIVTKYDPFQGILANFLDVAADQIPSNPFLEKNKKLRKKHETPILKVLQKINIPEDTKKEYLKIYIDGRDTILKKYIKADQTKLKNRAINCYMEEEEIVNQRNENDWYEIFMVAYNQNMQDIEENSQNDSDEDDLFESNGSSDC